MCKRAREWWVPLERAWGNHWWAFDGESIVCLISNWPNDFSTTWHSSNVPVTRYISRHCQRPRKKWGNKVLFLEKYYVDVWWVQSLRNFYLKAQRDELRGIRVELINHHIAKKLLWLNFGGRTLTSKCVLVKSLMSGVLWFTHRETHEGWFEKCVIKFLAINLLLLMIRLRATQQTPINSIDSSTLKTFSDVPIIFLFFTQFFER